METLVVWAAEQGPFPYGAAVVPVVSAVTFAYPDLASWEAVATRQAPGHIYSRTTNPTVSILEEKMACLDGSDQALGFATSTNTESIEAEVRRGCRLVYLETPTNPTLKVVDIARVAAVAHECGAIVVTDNTFATPVNQRPAEIGSDLVVYSATKFLAGRSDVLGG